jgi:hypothetical protein
MESLEMTKKSMSTQEVHYILDSKNVPLNERTNKVVEQDDLIEDLVLDEGTKIFAIPKTLMRRSSEVMNGCEHFKEQVKSKGAVEEGALDKNEAKVRNSLESPEDDLQTLLHPNTTNSQLMEVKEGEVKEVREIITEEIPIQVGEKEREGRMPMHNTINNL